MNKKSPGEILIFNAELIRLLQPRTQSDRTCVRRVCHWLEVNVNAGKFNERIFDRVLQLASEASGPDVRNRGALFMYLMKQELGRRVRYGTQVYCR